MDQKPPKKPHEMTTDEAVRDLFHPKVVEHAKRHAREAEKKSTRPNRDSTKES
jgi:hypothetical protein